MQATSSSASSIFPSSSPTSKHFRLFDLGLGSPVFKLNNLGNYTQHAVNNAPADPCGRAPLHTVLARRGDDVYRRSEVIWHDSDRYQHLLLQPLCQNGRLHVSRHSIGIFWL